MEEANNNIEKDTNLSKKEKLEQSKQIRKQKKALARERMPKSRWISILDILLNGKFLTPSTGTHLSKILNCINENEELESAYTRQLLIEKGATDEQLKEYSEDKVKKRFLSKVYLYQLRDELIERDLIAYGLKYRNSDTYYITPTGIEYLQSFKTLPKEDVDKIEGVFESSQESKLNRIVDNAIREQEDFEEFLAE